MYSRMEHYEKRDTDQQWYSNYQTLSDFFVDGRTPVNWDDYPKGTFEKIMGAFDWYDEQHFLLSKELKEANSTLDTLRD